VLLQQTRVAQATPYFERFVRAFPDVRALAAAPLDRVLKVWQGAGYYARARNLHAAARRIVRDYHGEIPSDVEALETLPGIGPYIARSVASIAFGVRTVALEANGLRVGARWFRADGDPRSGPVRRSIESSLRRAMAEQPPGAFNEAVMELGETICLPAAPRCDICPVATACRAYLELDDPGSVPASRRSARRPHYCGAIVVLEDGHGRWLVQRRPPRGLLGGLWEFPGGKIEPGESDAHAAARELFEETGARGLRLTSVGRVRHAYSHFTVELHVFRARVRPPSPRVTSDRKWVTPREMRRLALPKATEKALSLLPPPVSGRA
jgi:A/G-specific adenine glycosylase